MKLSIFKTIILSLVFSISQTTFASSGSTCDDAVVHNCSSSKKIRVCSYDGDDGLAGIAVQEKRISTGSSKTFKCNHKNCDFAASSKGPTCLGDGSGDHYTWFNVNLCGDLYIDVSIVDGESQWTDSETGCP